MGVRARAMVWYDRIGDCVLVRAKVPRESNAGG